MHADAAQQQDGLPERVSRAATWSECWASPVTSLFHGSGKAAGELFHGIGSYPHRAARRGAEARSSAWRSSRAISSRRTPAAFTSRPRFAPERCAKTLPQVRIIRCTGALSVHKIAVTSERSALNDVVFRLDGGEVACSKVRASSVEKFTCDDSGTVK